MFLLGIQMSCISCDFKQAWEFSCVVYPNIQSTPQCSAPNEILYGAPRLLRFTLTKGIQSCLKFIIEFRRSYVTQTGIA